MNINRDNYEEYFLLYADNELSGSDKEMVEAFVSDNIDLKDEFLMIQRTIFHPDENAVLADKSFLLEKEPGFITKNNYEEVFVLYYDDELSEKLKEETKNFVEQNIRFKKEFELFGRLKLVDDDSVNYPWKKHLYRKENHGKSISLIWMRSLAAAVLIGFGLWISISYIHKTSVDTSTGVSGNNTAESVSQGVKQEKTSSTKEMQNKKTHIISDNTSVTKKAIKNEPSVKKINHTNPQPAEELTAAEDSKPKFEIVKPDPVAVRLPVHLQPILSEKAAPLLTINKKVKDSLQDVASMNTKYKIDPGDAHNLPTQTMYDLNGNDENYVFYNVTEEEFRKSKVGSFLKKVKRVVERSNPIARLITGYEE